LNDEEAPLVERRRHDAQRFKLRALAQVSFIVIGRPVRCRDVMERIAVDDPVRRLVPFRQRLLDHVDRQRRRAGLVESDPDDPLRRGSVLDADEIALVEIKPVDAAKMRARRIGDLRDRVGFQVEDEETGEIVGDE